MKTEVSAATVYEVTLKAIEAVRVAAVQAIVPCTEQPGDTLDMLFGILESYVSQYGRVVGPYMAIYRDACPGSQILEMHLEAAIPFEGDGAPEEQIRVYELQRVEQMACTSHKGPFEELGRAHDALCAWARQHDYQASGPVREVYLTCGDGDSAGYITEVQLPVTPRPVATHD